MLYYNVYHVYSSHFSQPNLGSLPPHLRRTTILAFLAPYAVKWELSQEESWNKHVIHLESFTPFRYCALSCLLQCLKELPYVFCPVSQLFYFGLIFSICVCVWQNKFSTSSRYLPQVKRIFPFFSFYLFILLHGISIPI